MKRFTNRAARVSLGYLLLSALIHLTAGTLFGWLIWQRTMQLSRQAGEPQILITTAVTIERRRAPQARAARIRPTPLPSPVPTSQTRVEHLARSERARPQPARRQVLRETLRPPHLTPRAPAARSAPQSFSETLAQQEQQFAHTIAQARAKDNPVTGAATGVRAASAPAKHFTIEFGGSLGGTNEPEGYLDPVRSWHDAGYNYYYVRYVVTYADGSTEEGIVPWPIHYSPGADPFLRGWHRMPLPGPPADYVLPRGTSLHPLVAFCYMHRLVECPIERGAQ